MQLQAVMQLNKLKLSSLEAELWPCLSATHSSQDGPQALPMSPSIAEDVLRMNLLEWEVSVFLRPVQLTFQITLFQSTLLVVVIKFLHLTLVAQWKFTVCLLLISRLLKVRGQAKQQLIAALVKMDAATKLQSHPRKLVLEPITLNSPFVPYRAKSTHAKCTWLMRQSKLLDIPPSETLVSFQATMSHPTSLPSSFFHIPRSLRSFRAQVLLILLWPELPWLPLSLHSPSDSLSESG